MHIQQNEIVKFDFQKNNIEVIMIDGEPWFMGKGVADALGYANSRKAIADHVEEEDKQILMLQGQVGYPARIIINEPGLYSLIFSSKLPEAKTFKRWVTHEVLPSLRKTGSYSLTNATEAELLREIQKTNEKLNILIAQNQQKNSKKRLPTDSGMPDAEKLMIIETITELAKQGEQVKISYPQMHELVRKKYGSDFFPARPTAFLKALEPELREKGISLLNIGKSVKINKVPVMGFVIVTLKSCPCRA